MPPNFPFRESANNQPFVVLTTSLLVILIENTGKNEKVIISRISEMKRYNGNIVET